MVVLKNKESDLKLIYIENVERLKILEKWFRMRTKVRPSASNANSFLLQNEKFIKFGVFLAAPGTHCLVFTVGNGPGNITVSDIREDKCVI